ncbi:MAG: NAD(P)/FAD-dependent oxidoreductase [Thalassobaculaceae bacterium]
MTGRPSSWDAAVVGGGPAGAIAAMRLAPKHRVLVLERAAAPAARIGESLPPACRPLLRDLGLLDRMADHRPYLGNRSLWGGGPATHDFLRDLHGAGWHLDRARFDAMLQTAAREAGAEIRRGTTLRTVMPRERIRSLEGGWGLVTNLGERLHARVLIDATGRASAVCRRLGARRRVADRLTAVYCRLRGAPHAPRDAFSRIEAVDDGWWYTAPLPDGGRVAGFHTDSDSAALRALATEEGFLRALCRTRLIADEVTLAGTGVSDGPHLVPANGAFADPPAGDGWLAVGDAALSLDPLSSQGLMNALFTGMAGGDAAVAMLGGDDAAAEAYAARIAAVRAAYAANLAHFYAAEADRRGGAFWARRSRSPLRAAGGA